MTTAEVTPAQLRSARTATFTLFALAGATFAMWASRIPDLKIALDMTAGQLGVTLLAMSVGSVLAMPLTGRLVERRGARWVLRGGQVIGLLGALVVGMGVDLLDSRAVVAGGLFVFGLGFGAWDVSMNLEGADVERHLGRAVMPHFHAAFSAATVASALVGALAAWADVPIWLHFLVAIAVVLATGTWALARTLPDEATASGALSAERTAGTFTAGRSPWTEPRTLLIGVLVLVAAFTEGTANDWIAVAFHTGHGVPTWAGVVAFAVFLSAMTAGRLLGTGLIDRHGRVPVLRVCFTLAAAGSLMVVFGSAPVAYAGAVVWGVGASLGFPVGMSAAADDPRRAAARMSVIATIGYTGFIAGPPLLGFLGDQVGVLRSLLVVGAGAILALLVVPATREEGEAAEALAEQETATA